VPRSAFQQGVSTLNAVELSGRVWAIFPEASPEATNLTGGGSTVCPIGRLAWPI